MRYLLLSGVAWDTRRDLTLPFASLHRWCVLGAMQMSAFPELARLTRSRSLVSLRSLGGENSMTWMGKR